MIGIPLISEQKNGILNIGKECFLLWEVDNMTVQQEAYQMIDRLSDDAVEALIRIMECMLPEKGIMETEEPGEAAGETNKRKAYLRLKTLRSEMKNYDFSEADRAEGLAEKYGTY